MALSFLLLLWAILGLPATAHFVVLYWDRRYRDDWCYGYKMGLCYSKEHMPPDRAGSAGFNASRAHGIPEGMTLERAHDFIVAKYWELNADREANRGRV